MIRFITRKDFELLGKDETKTVTFFSQKEKDDTNWAGYFETQGGAVCVQVREISECERKMLEGEALSDEETKAFVKERPTADDFADFMGKFLEGRK